LEIPAMGCFGDAARASIRCSRDADQFTGLIGWGCLRLAVS